IKIDDPFAETLAPDGGERFLHGHVCLQQRLIDTRMSRDRVVEIRKRGRIGHAVALHRRPGNARSREQGAESREQKSESSAKRNLQTTAQRSTSNAQLQ